MKLNLTSIAVLLFTFSMTACSTGPLDVAVPMNRLDSPEANGEEHRLRGDIGHRSNHRIRLTEDYGREAISGSSPKIESIAKAGLSLGVGVLERLDFDLKATAEVPVMIQAKYQFLGVSRGKSEPGNFSMAVSMAVGRAESDEQRTDLSGIFGGTSNIASYSMERSIFDLGWIVGHRFSETALTYGGLSFTRLQWEGRQKMFTGTDTAFKGQAKQGMIHAGFILESQAAAYAQFEASLARLRTENAIATHANGAVTVGVHF